jgi:exopolyphosphatase/guanosine-5'-triphosphate,3'-diphosphate pyrophosphatase
MIRWARIPGLDDARREMIAMMARAHRKDAARARELIDEAKLSKEQRGQLRRLTGLLRIADALDTDHRSRVEQVVATRMGEAICLDLVVRDGPSRDDARLVRKADLLEKELGVEIRVTVARPVIAQPSPEASGSRLQVVRDKAR